ncbi:hypothetical protein [Salinimicrobium sp. GXAS 041]|uniref:hypothetical protein n=1 Tax=Salinimicrobium sp. GXAS 041 TaxID=3400806 RepID=UPI003C74D699
MNLVRILGFLLFMAGIAIGYYFDDKNLHFLSGALIGAGGIWMVLGRIRMTSKE